MFFARFIFVQISKISNLNYSTSVGTELEYGDSWWTGA